MTVGRQLYATLLVTMPAPNGLFVAPILSAQMTGTYAPSKYGVDGKPRDICRAPSTWDLQINRKRDGLSDARRYA
jgi:hypothetical protein